MTTSMPPGVFDRLQVSDNAHMGQLCPLILQGPVVVGDIGTASRINYTIVGDAVNATQRLESLGKTIDPDAEAIALVSAEVFAAAPAGFQFIDRGAHLAKGKQESLKVFQLVGGPEEGASAAMTSDRIPGS
jgi:adenylate cyclase